MVRRVVAVQQLIKDATNGAETETWASASSRFDVLEEVIQETRLPYGLSFICLRVINRLHSGKSTPVWHRDGR